MTENTVKSRKSQSQRVRMLRDLLDISRPKFAARHPRLSKSNIRNWEEGDKSGLSDSGARYLAAAAQSLGVTVSEEWLLDGIGRPPEKPIIETVNTETGLDLESALRTLCKRFPQTMSVLIKNDTLTPALSTGDFAVGERLPSDNIANAVNSLCIVETIEGEIQIGYLEKTADDEYSLQDKAINVLSVAPITLVMRAPGAGS